MKAAQTKHRNGRDLQLLSMSGFFSLFAWRLIAQLGPWSLVALCLAAVTAGAAWVFWPRAEAVADAEAPALDN